MCTGSAPSAPPPPARLPEAPRTPGASDTGTGEDQERRRKRASASRGGTILTSPRGVTDSGATAQKTLLGQ